MPSDRIIDTRKEMYSSAMKFSASVCDLLTREKDISMVN